MNKIRKTIKADAVLWDFDGTLADSAAKNIAITVKILERVAPRLCGENLPRYLRSEDDYQVANHGAENWRSLYRDYFGMNAAEVKAAGGLWETYQMRDTTAVRLYDGVTETVRRLSALPQGICSANATRNIRRVLENNGLNGCFQSVVGYEGLPRSQQKPAPHGGLRCLGEIFGETRGKTIVYIGDHLADVIFSRGLAERLDPSNRVVSIILEHSGAKPANWRVQPDEVLESPAQLADLIRD